MPRGRISNIDSAWDPVESMDHDDTITPPDSFDIVDLKGDIVEISRTVLQSQAAAFEDYSGMLEDARDEKNHWFYFLRNFVLRDLHTWLLEAREIRVHMLPYQVYGVLVNLHTALHHYVNLHTDLHTPSLKKKYLDDAMRIVFNSQVIALFVPVLRRLIKFSFYMFSSQHHEALLPSEHVNSVRLSQMFVRINRLLLARHSINFATKDLTDIYVAATHHIIDKFMLNECAKKDWKNNLARLRNYVDHINVWAKAYMIEPMSYRHLTDQVELYAIQKFIDCHINIIYDTAITYFPDTVPLALDLKTAIIETQGYGRVKLAETLVYDVRSRLLNVGVSTNDILRAYASAVDCLKLIDPSSVIMHKVCGVIKDYLKTRQDTVKSIIMYITTEKREELTMNAKDNHVMFDEDGMREVNADFMVKEDAETWQNWNPDPVDANKGDNSYFRESADVFNMLVSVYGSKDQFIKEYRQLLAERLTSTAERDLSFESRYLELMKRRFTEGELQQCEVMLRDMSDSEAFDRVKTTPGIPFCMQGRIMSSFFWPKLETERVKPPEIVEKAMEIYRKAFEDQKANQRTLKWIPSLGYMDLELEIYGKTIHITLPTAQVAILLKFLEKDSWTIEELCTELQMTKSLTKRRCEWFAKNGLLKQKIVENSVAEWYTLADQPGLLEKFEKRMENEEEESDEEEEPTENTEAIDALEQFWTYTKNFISNQEPVKAERIHTIFKMFASPGKQGPTIVDVTGFLQRKVRANLLTFNNGYYRAVKGNVGQ